jgi:hypothetical protein
MFSLRGTCFWRGPRKCSMGSPPSAASEGRYGRYQIGEL